MTIARRVLLAGLFTGTVFVGTASAQRYIGPEYPPLPPPREERLPPPPPGRRVVWEPGQWRWDGRGYVWIAGHYVAERRGRFIPGHWERRGPNWFWVAGHRG
jgi:hypothetical protein